MVPNCINKEAFPQGALGVLLEALLQSPTAVDSQDANRGGLSLRGWGPFCLLHQFYIPPRLPQTLEDDKGGIAPQQTGWDSLLHKG